MNILLAVNEKHQAVLLHDQKLGFRPSWVEFSHDGRGIRIIGEDGTEYLAGVTVDKATLDALHNVNDILLVWMKQGVPMDDGYIVTFVNQYYDQNRPEGANNGGRWS